MNWFLPLIFHGACGGNMKHIFRRYLPKNCGYINFNCNSNGMVNCNTDKHIVALINLRIPCAEIARVKPMGQHITWWQVYDNIRYALFTRFKRTLKEIEAAELSWKVKCLFWHVVLNTWLPYCGPHCHCICNELVTWWRYQMDTFSP